MLSKLTNNKYEQSYETLFLYNSTPSQTEQNTPLNKQDAYERHGNYDASKQESNGTTVTDELVFASNETEQDFPLNEQDNHERCGNFDSGYQITNGVPVTGENEHFLVLNELTDTKNMDIQPTNILEHSLTKCQYCQTTFPYSLVELHAQTCNESMTNRHTNILEDNLIKCQFCQSIFPDSLLEQHMQTCTRRKIHKCSKCEKRFRIQSKLLIHQQVHSDERPYPCKICAKPFKFRSGLSRHMRRRHSSGGETDLEKLCGERQREENSTLQEGINFQKGDSCYKNSMKENGQCKFDESNFGKEHCTTQTDFETSRQGQEDINLKNCYQNIVKENEQCEYMETNIRDVNFRQGPSTFEIEEKDLKQNNSIVCIENVKELENNFEVNQTPAQISNEHLSNATLSLHMQRCDKSKVYQCEYCPRIFEKPSRLMVHKRIHSEERLFTCEICQQTFKHKGSLTRHVKEQHYGQGRKSFSMIVDERQRSKLEHCAPLEKINFENVDQYLVNENESCDYTGKENNHSDESLDEGQNNLSMVFDGRQGDEKSLSLQDESSFQNVDNTKKFLVKENETFKYEEDHFEENNLMQEQSMIFGGRQGDDHSLSLQHKVSFENVDNTNEYLVNKSETFKYEGNSFEIQGSVQQEQNNLSIILGGRQGDEKSFSSQGEITFQNVDNTNDYHERESENREYKENNFEVQENLKQAENILECDERNLGNSRPSEISNECFSNGTLSVNMKKCKEDKVYKCQDCPKMFPTPSALRKHKHIHNDAMSFSCQICGQYFKYKGSLNRHVKEQHYGQGRKSLSMVVDEKDGNKLENCPPLDKINFENADQRLVKVNRSLEYNGGATRYLKEQDFGEGRTGHSMIVNETHGNELENYCSPLEKINFDYKENNHSGESLDHEEQNNPSMVFDGRQGDEKTLTLPDEVSFQNVGNTEECLVRESETYKYEENNHSSESLDKRHNNLSMVFDGRQGDEKTFALPDEGSFQNVDNTNEYHENQSETCQYEENNFEENNLEKEENNPSDALSVNMQRCKKSKVYKCQDCQEMFPTPSALRKHKTIHNDAMSFSCQICGQYFKYKGSLSRHVKEQHYGEGRKSLSLEVDEKKGNKQENCSPLDKINFENADQCLVKVNRSLQYNGGVTRDSKKQHLNQGRKDVNMVVDEVQRNKLENCLSFEKINFANGDKYLMSENESCGYKENIHSSESSDEGQNNLSMVFDGRQGDERTLALPDEVSFHVENTNEYHENKNETCKCEENNFEENNLEQEQNNPSMIFGGRQEDEKSLSVQDEEIYQNAQLQNINDYHERKSGTWEYEENNFEVQENLKQAENNFKSGERNLGKKESCFEYCEEIDEGVGNHFEVNTRPSEISNGCFSNAKLSVNMERCKEDKVYKCQDCQKIFPKPSALRKHERTHNDTMSFSCQICEQYFKYKGSLSRHVKEQHYGQGRKGLRMEFNERLGKKKRKKGKLIFLQAKVDFQNKVSNSLAIANEDDNKESSVKEIFEPNMIPDERPGNYKDNNVTEDNFEQVQSNFEIKRNENEQNHSLQKKDDLNKNGSEHILQEEEKKLNIKQNNLKICSDNLEDVPLKFSCEVCGKYFKYKGSLARHFKEQHLDQGRKASQQGNFEFEKRNLDTKQNSFDGGQNNGATKSKLGNHSVDKKDNLSSESGTSLEHILQEIDQEEGMFDSRQDNFEAYYLKLLNTKKVHRCPECPKTFWTTSELKEHTYKHADIRSFACTLCGKAFKFRSGLVRHNRKEHKKNGLTKDVVSENKGCSIDGNSLGEVNLKQERSNSVIEESYLGNKEHSEFCGEVEANEFIKCGGGEEHVETILDETSGMDESCSSVENINPVLKGVDHITNAEVSTQSVRQKLPSQKKSATYSCNKCDAVFKQLCDFLTHQRIHK